MNKILLIILLILPTLAEAQQFTASVTKTIPIFAYVKPAVGVGIAVANVAINADNSKQISFLNLVGATPPSSVSFGLLKYIPSENIFIPDLLSNGNISYFAFDCKPFGGYSGFNAIISYVDNPESTLGKHSYFEFFKISTENIHNEELLYRSAAFKTNGSENSGFIDKSQLKNGYLRIYYKLYDNKSKSIPGVTSFSTDDHSGEHAGTITFTFTMN